MTALQVHATLHAAMAAWVEHTQWQVRKKAAAARAVLSWQGRYIAPAFEAWLDRARCMRDLKRRLERCLQVPYMLTSVR